MSAHMALLENKTLLAALETRDEIVECISVLHSFLFE